MRLADVERYDKTVDDADEKGATRRETWIKGCRTTRGDYCGVSMFNRVSPAFKGGTWYKLPKDDDIPVALAVLRDGAITDDRLTHFTIAPKDDMPLAL